MRSPKPTLHNLHHISTFCFSDHILSLGYVYNDNYACDILSVELNQTSDTTGHKRPYEEINRRPICLQKTSSFMWTLKLHMEIQYKNTWKTKKKVVTTKPIITTNVHLASFPIESMINLTLKLSHKKDIGSVSAQGPEEASLELQTKGNRMFSLARFETIYNYHTLLTYKHRPFGLFSLAACFPFLHTGCLLLEQ